MDAATPPFRSLGFLMRRVVSRSESMDAELVPEKVVSVSDCISPGMPGTWALAWSDEERQAREKRAFDAGIRRSCLDDAVAWAAARFDRDILWPDVVTNLATARELLTRFVDPSVDVRLLECLISLEDYDRLDAALAPKHPSEGEPGMLVMLRRGVAPHAGGSVLGSDVVAPEVGGSFHSYLCNGLERDFSERYGARPDALGLYGDHVLARQCALMAEGEKLGEPLPWFAMRIVEHPREP